MAGSYIRVGRRPTITATRLAQRSGVSGNDLASTYYASITRMLGCTATAMEGASLAAGEDQQLNLALLSCDWSDASEVEAAFAELLPAELSAQQRRAAITSVSKHIPRSQRLRDFTAYRR